MRISDWSSDVCSSDLEPFKHAASRKGDHVPRRKREHLFVALESCARTEPAIECEGQLLDAATLGPAGGQAVGALAITAVNQNHIRDIGVYPVERRPNVVGKDLGALVEFGSESCMERVWQSGEISGVAA